MNPNSEQIIELGTRQYPFKHINLVFIDIFNKFSYSDISVNIHVMENTYNYLPVDSIKLINITSININSYSEYNLDDPKHALFVIIDTEIDMLTERTLFNIIQNTTMNSLDTTNMEQIEADEILESSDYVIIVNRCNLDMNNIDVYSQITSNSLNVDFILPIHQFSNKVTLTNMHFQVKGTVYSNSIASSNLLVENATLDMFESTGGFVYISACTYEGDLNLASLEFYNIYAYTSQEHYLTNGLILNRGNANTTINNITVETYVDTTAALRSITYRFLPTCSPQDDVTQVFEIDSMLMTLQDNPINRKKSGMAYATPAGSMRHYKFIIKNTRFIDMEGHAYPDIFFFGRYNEEGIVQNITVENSSYTDM